MTDKHEIFWFVRVEDPESGLASLITKSKDVYNDNGLIDGERLLAVKSDSVNRWIWVKNPERTAVCTVFVRENLIFKSRREATREELVAIKLSANNYEGRKAR